MSSSDDAMRIRYALLRDRVVANNGVLSLSMKEIRDSYQEASRIGGVVRSRMEDQLSRQGLRHIPEDLPNSQDKTVRLYVPGSSASRVIDAALTPGEHSDEIIHLLASCLEGRGAPRDTISGLSLSASPPAPGMSGVGPGPTLTEPTQTTVAQRVPVASPPESRRPEHGSRPSPVTRRIAGRLGVPVSRAVEWGIETHHQVDAILDEQPDWWVAEFQKIDTLDPKERNFRLAQFLDIHVLAVQRFEVSAAQALAFRHDPPGWLAHAQENWVAERNQRKRQGQFA